MSPTLWQLWEMSQMPARRQCLVELEEWLREVKYAGERRRLTDELKGSNNIHHPSARFELFMHHYFAGRSWGTQWHPLVSGTSRRLDLFLRKGAQEVLVEARTSEQEAESKHLEQFGEQLQEYLGQIPSPYEVPDIPFA